LQLRNNGIIIQIENINYEKGEIYIMTAKQENLVVLNLSAEAFGSTGLNKNQFEALLVNAIKCDFIITGCNGQEVKLEIMQEIRVENISLSDEHGYEIESADELTI
jgi:hypothetical protein